MRIFFYICMLFSLVFADYSDKEIEILLNRIVVNMSETESIINKYLLDSQTPQDALKLAIADFTKKCNNENKIKPCFMATIFLRLAENTEHKDTKKIAFYYNKSMRLIKEVCDISNDSDHCFVFGLMLNDAPMNAYYIFDDGLTGDKDKIEKTTLDYIIKACNIKPLQGCYFIHDYYYFNLKQPQKALAIAKEFCEKKKVAKSCDVVGDYYMPQSNLHKEFSLYKAESYEKDVAKAVKYYEKKYLITNIYKNKYGAALLAMPQCKKGIEFLNKKCDRTPDACFTLGLAYDIGECVPKDIEKAKFYYKKGCLLGDKLLCDRYNSLLGDK